MSTCSKLQRANFKKKASKEIIKAIQDIANTLLYNKNLANQIPMVQRKKRKKIIGLIKKLANPKGSIILKKEETCWLIFGKELKVYLIFNKINLNKMKLVHLSYYQQPEIINSLKNPNEN